MEVGRTRSPEPYVCRRARRGPRDIAAALRRRSEGHPHERQHLAGRGGCRDRPSHHRRRHHLPGWAPGRRRRTARRDSVTVTDAVSIAGIAGDAEGCATGGVQPGGGGAPNCLAPGTYRLSGDVWPGEITMEVPAGWFEWEPYTWNDAYDALLVDSRHRSRLRLGPRVQCGRYGREGPVRSSEGDLRPSRDRHRRRC